MGIVEITKAAWRFVGAGRAGQPFASGPPSADAASGAAVSGQVKAAAAKPVRRGGPRIRPLPGDVSGPLQERIVSLIQDLRNSRGVEANWPVFRDLVESNTDEIVATFSMRWLVSICDTYADYGDAIERRHALLISMFVNMIRLAETTRYIRGPIVPDQLAATKEKLVALYDGVSTFSIDRQDVYLNLSKRMARQLEENELMSRIWKEIVGRLHRGDNVVSEFQRLSAMPERYFPPDPLSIKDNYGI